MNCPKCHEDRKIRNGIINALQRYKCKECGYNFSVEKRHNEYPAHLRRQALHLYLEGMNYRAIEQTLGVSNVTILYWIKELGPKIESIRERKSKITSLKTKEFRDFIKTKGYTNDPLLILIGSSSHDSETLKIDIKD